MSNVPVLQGSPRSARIAARAHLSALIVDDESHVRAFTRQMLTSLGVATIWEANGGAAGMALYAEHRPSVVLLDVNMPFMSGDVMMARLMAIDPTVAVIVMTSANKAEIVRFFQELGAIGYVLKHIPREEAMDLMADALDSLLVGDEMD